MSYINLREEYDALVTRVERALRVLIANSKVDSKHVDSKAIEAYSYGEIAIIDDKLVFIDENGHHHTLESEFSLDELIDIINKQ